MKIKLLVEGGNAKPGPALSQQIGPLGINLGKLIAEVNKASESFKGMKVPVIVDIDTDTKAFKITVKKPPTSELIKKELDLAKGASDSKAKIANLAVEQAIKIAKEKQDDMLTTSFREAVKNVIATCTSLGVLVEGKEPKEVIAEINNGMYKDLIDKKVTEVNLDKKKILGDQFEKIKAILEKKRKVEEAEKKVKEEKEEKTKEAKTEEKEEEKKEGKEEKGKEKKPEGKEKKPEEKTQAKGKEKEQKHKK
ncbi:MAG: 50S ribosomal protein L11 [Nanoarchaeota archaeon]|nr:50S ribosomal protein L11 [Nanoarchaeota archaeon]